MTVSRSSRALVGVVAGVTLAVVLAGCGPTGSDAQRPAEQQLPPVFTVDPDVPVLDDVAYTVDADGTEQLLDVCLPPVDAPGGTDAGAADRARPAMILVHGGSWRRGTKNDVANRSTCQWLAKAGFPTFNIDYRLAPDHPFPAGFDDVRAAVDWIREPEQLERFAIDGERIGALGASAGGNLVALLGTSGEGSPIDGTRVAAVVDLSGPVDLTGRDVTRDFLPVQLSYLGCSTQADCPQAAAASAATFIDDTDPPYFVAHSLDEFIPLGQSSRFVAQLRDAGITVTYVEVPGVLHAIQLLDDRMKAAILQFLATELVDRAPRAVP